MKRVNLIADDSGAGLTRDLRLLTLALEAEGCAVTVITLAHKKGTLGDALRLRWQALARARRDGRPWRADLNIMLERIYPGLFGLARRNLLIPNPEWFPTKLVRHLPAFDRILVKTHHAEEILRPLGRPLTYIGFTSEDRLAAEVPRRPEFVHIPGKSPLKGTLPLVRLWAEHPRWPRLTVVFRAAEAAELPAAANVTLLRERLGEAELLALQNAAAFHLCPSETEGYGHYLAEAMSLGAVTVTLDAPPMNELVRPERGILVPARPLGRRSLATCYGYRPEDMAAAVERCLALTPGERDALGAAARRWFLANAAGFPARLAAALP